MNSQTGLQSPARRVTFVDAVARILIFLVRGAFVGIGLGAAEGAMTGPPLAPFYLQDHGLVSQFFGYALGGALVGGWTGLWCGPPAFLIVALTTLSAPDGSAVFAAATSEAWRLTVRAVFCGELGGFFFVATWVAVEGFLTGTYYDNGVSPPIHLWGAMCGVILAFVIFLFIGAIRGGLREKRAQILVAEIEAMQAGSESSTL